MKQQNKLADYIDTLWLAIGEAVVVLLVFVGFLIARSLGAEVTIYKVITGALLGALVTVANFLILSISLNRATSRYMAELDGKKLTEEEAIEYANKHKDSFKLASASSYLPRNVMMIGALLLAGISKQFDIIATAIPLLMYRPVLYVTEFIKIKVKRGD